VPGADNNQKTADANKPSVRLDCSDLLNMMYVQFQLGKIPYHVVCGAMCDYLSEPRQGQFFWFGVSCPKCLRTLMEGEIHYADSK
jgi:hypothetical protein